MGKLKKNILKNKLKEKSIEFKFKEIFFIRFINHIIILNVFKHIEIQFLVLKSKVNFSLSL